MALLADEERDWDTDGDIVRLIALATEPIMDRLTEVISSLDNVISDSSAEDTDVVTE